MKKRYVFFRGLIQTLDLYTNEFVNIFTLQKAECLVLNAFHMEDEMLRLKAFLLEPVSAVISMNNIGLHLEFEDGKNIWDQFQIPFFNILMDHPFCYHSALAFAPKNAVVLCTDRNHMNYVSRFYPDIPATGYLPHGGIEADCEKKPMKERSIDVLYAGGLSKSFAKNTIPDLSKYTDFDMKKVCGKAYRTLIGDPDRTTESALEEALLSEGVRFEDSRLAEVIADLHFVDLYAVSYFREKTIQTLAESGIEIMLYGAGWENCTWINLPNVCYGGRVAAGEIVRKMQDAKIVLSTMTWFKDGTHDRVFNGMLQGAAAVSDTSVYMKEEFCGFCSPDGTDRRELVLFELKEITSLPEQIKKLLADSRLLQEIADRGYDKAKTGHTWHHRAKELKTDILDNHELMDYLHSTMK